VGCAGIDVARKVVILARECGLQLDLEDVQVESLVPEPLRSSSSVLDFMERLPQVHSPPFSLQCEQGRETLIPHKVMVLLRIYCRLLQNPGRKQLAG
jgi:hypothetical protein